jgi:hypothetical protein
VAPSSRAQEVADRLSQSLNGIETHVVPLPSVDLLGSWLRRDLESVRSALLTPAGGSEAAIREAMGALPRARRMASLLESLVPLLSSSAALDVAQPLALKRAPKTTVDKLPTRSYCAKAGVTRECYICLDTYVDGDEMRQLPCKHEFHSKCVDRWLLDVHSTCPCCRADVCLQGHDGEEEDKDGEAEATSERALTAHTRYDELRPSRTQSAGSMQHNGALNAEQASLQLEHLESRNSLQHSITQLQILRARQACLLRERQRLEHIHTELSHTRQHLRSELDSLRQRSSQNGSTGAPRSSVAMSAGVSGGPATAGAVPWVAARARGHRDAVVEGREAGRRSGSERLRQRWASVSEEEEEEGGGEASEEDSSPASLGGNVGGVGVAYTRHVRAARRASSESSAVGRVGRGTAASVLRRSGRNEGAGSAGAQQQQQQQRQRGAARVAADYLRGNERGNERARSWLAQRSRRVEVKATDSRGVEARVLREMAGRGAEERATDAFTRQRRASGGAHDGFVTTVGGIEGVNGGGGVPTGRFLGGSWRYNLLHRAAR